MVEKSLREVQALRWLAPLWVSLLMFWGVQSFFLGDYDRSGEHTWHNPTTVICALLLLALHIGVYMLGTLRQPRRWWYLTYCTIQSGLICSIALLLQSWTTSLLLFLPAMTEAIGVLRLRRVTLVVLAEYAIFFYLTLQLLSSRQVVPVRGALLIILPSIAFLGLVVLLFLRQVHAREQAQAIVHELESSHRQLAASIARVEELTLLTERQRIARELHDTLAQGLAGLILQLEAVRLHLEQEHVERATTIVQQAQERARAALARARCAIDDLRAIPDDFTAAIDEEIKRFVTATGIACDVNLTDLAALPESSHEHTLYAIAEGLANVAHHAQAHHVWVEAHASSASVAITVRDDGIGFAPALVAEKAGHYGLLGLRERARLAGGTFSVLSAPAVGTTLQLHLPREAQEMVNASHA